jgi:FPC/CPF motif-containing protein YcgG
MVTEEKSDMENDEEMIDMYKGFLGDKNFPCVAGKAALSNHQVQCLVVDHMACEKNDTDILDFLYEFVDMYRHSERSYHSAAIIFKAPVLPDEVAFDKLLWQRLQSLSDLDAKKYSYDKRVNADPSSPEFSFSLKGEAFFIIGLHPASSRLARRFGYPALVFNFHAEFEKLKEGEDYEKIRHKVRKNDLEYSGSVNPMLADYGQASEVYQYSGRNYPSDWECPFKPKHERT